MFKMSLYVVALLVAFNENTWTQQFEGVSAYHIGEYDGQVSTKPLSM